MNFRDWILLEMTEDEAREVLGLRSGEDVSAAYRRASLSNHPDRGGSDASMKRVNRAFEVLSSRPSASSFVGSESYSNLNYCLKAIREESGRSGPTSPYTFWAWDGTHFRGVFTAETNPESFHFAAMVMERWNESFPHRTKAVFVEVGERELLLLRLDGGDVVSGERFSHESFNKNPGNDPGFVGMLRRLYPA